MHKSKISFGNVYRIIEDVARELRSKDEFNISSDEMKKAMKATLYIGGNHAQHRLGFYLDRLNAEKEDIKDNGLSKKGRKKYRSDREAIADIDLKIKDVLEDYVAYYVQNESFNKGGANYAEYLKTVADDETPMSYYEFVFNQDPSNSDEDDDDDDDYYDDGDYHNDDENTEVEYEQYELTLTRNREGLFNWKTSDGKYLFKNTWFSNATEFQNGLAFVETREGGKNVVTTSGKCLFGDDFSKEIAKIKVNDFEGNDYIILYMNDDSNPVYVYQNFDNFKELYRETGLPLSSTITENGYVVIYIKKDGKTYANVVSPEGRLLLNYPNNVEKWIPFKYHKYSDEFFVFKGGGGEYFYLNNESGKLYDKNGKKVSESPKHDTNNEEPEENNGESGNEDTGGSDNGQLSKWKWDKLYHVVDGNKRTKTYVVKNKKTGKYNWMRNHKRGEFMSDEWYDEVGNFVEDRARCKGKEGWNWIKLEDGKLLCSTWFDDVSDFKDGRAVASVDGRKVYVSKKDGNVIDEHGHVKEYEDDNKIKTSKELYASKLDKDGVFHGVTEDSTDVNGTPKMFKLQLDDSNEKKAYVGIALDDEEQFKLSKLKPNVIERFVAKPFFEKYSFNKLKKKYPNRGLKPHTVKHYVEDPNGSKHLNYVGVAVKGENGVWRLDNGENKFKVLVIENETTDPNNMLNENTKRSVVLTESVLEKIIDKVIQELI